MLTIKRRLIGLVSLIKAHSILTMALVFAFVMAATPAYATSFSINTTDLLSAAADIFNGLWPAFAIVAGLGLGIALVRFIVNSLKSVF